MKLRFATLVLPLGAAVGLAAIAHAGGDRVKFPESFDKGVLYTTVERTDIKQVRELFTSAEAVAAAKAGQPLPDGTIITMVHYKAKVDAAGNLEKDANGRLIKAEPAGFGVMEKKAGWGAAYPEDVRNGDWEYQTFKADKTVNDKAELNKCFACHKPQAKGDYLFSYEAMKTAN